MKSVRPFAFAAGGWVSALDASVLAGAGQAVSAYVFYGVSIVLMTIALILRHRG